jgi:tetratricopeptide (TPR) repeat protein
MFDLLAHNNWERPVYYVSTTGSETYIGLENYLKLEGFAYRLVPIPGQARQNDVGEVNTEVMFDNLMNKFEFEIRKPGFLISEDIFRMTVTMRNSYARLAESLAAENKMDKAVQVCDRIQEMIPDKIVPFNYFNLGIADTYLKAGQTDKGVEILQRLLEISDEQLAYFFSFPGDKQGYISGDIQQSMAVLHAAGQAARDNGQEEIAKQAEETLDLYYNLYLDQPGNR